MEDFTKHELWKPERLLEVLNRLDVPLEMPRVLRGLREWFPSVSYVSQQYVKILRLTKVLRRQLERVQAEAHVAAKGALSEAKPTVRDIDAWIGTNEPWRSKIEKLQIEIEGQEEAETLYKYLREIVFEQKETLRSLSTSLRGESFVGDEPMTTRNERMEGVKAQVNAEIERRVTKHGRKEDQGTA